MSEYINLSVSSDDIYLPNTCLQMRVQEISFCQKSKYTHRFINNTHIHVMIYATNKHATHAIQWVATIHRFFEHSSLPDPPDLK